MSQIKVETGALYKFWHCSIKHTHVSKQFFLYKHLMLMVVIDACISFSVHIHRMKQSLNTTHRIPAGMKHLIR